MGGKKYFKFDLTFKYIIHVRKMYVCDPMKLIMIFYAYNVRDSKCILGT